MIIIKIRVRVKGSFDVRVRLLNGNLIRIRAKFWVKFKVRKRAQFSL